MRRAQASLSLRKLGSRGFWSLLSQALSSATNVAVAIFVARGESPAGLGAWSLAYVGYVVALGLNRAVSSTPMILSDAHAERTSHREVVGAVTTSSVLGVAIAMVLVGAAILGSPSFRASALVIAVILPLLLAQDTLRYVFFRQRKPALAAVLDAIWAVSMTIGVLFLVGPGNESAVTVTAVWGVSGALSALGGLGLSRAGISARTGFWFIKKHKVEALSLAADSALVALGTQSLPLILTITSGLAAAGTLRAGQTLMGGIALIVIGLTPVATVEIVRELHLGRSQWKILWIWSSAIATAAACYCGMLLVLPAPLGRSLLGSNWSGATTLLLPLSIQAMLRGPFTGVPMILKARQQMTRVVSLRIRNLPPAILFPSVGALWGGVYGAAWGICAGAVITNLQCIVFLNRWGSAASAD